MFRSGILALTLLLVACSDSSDRSASSPQPPLPPELPAVTYSAELRRTAYGIPHIKADDWGSLGYGFGYAYAQDNFCVAMREIVFATGRSAELMGETEGSVESDFLFRYLNGDKASFEREFVDSLPQFARDLAEGYTRGMNRYLEETGVDNLPGGELGCRNAPWVFAFDSVDLFLFLRREALRGSSDQGIFRRAILAVDGPNKQGMLGPAPASALSGEIGEAMPALIPGDRGSNGLALGRDLTRNGRGMLLGNPHQPWFGAGAWYQVHLTLPGEYDVAGAALHGFPFVGIGFNRDVAWTHTVSYANRFSLYELKLNPDNPLQYRYGEEWREIVERPVTIEVRLADGSLETREKIFWESHYGPVVDLREVSPALAGWPMFNGSVLAFRDANLLTGIRGIEQWIRKGQASDLEDYIQALGNIGNPVFHEIAADRHGEAFYGELSAVPFVTGEQLDRCINGAIGPLLASATSNVILSLDGSDPACEWGSDPRAPAGSNLYSAAQLPQLRTTDYVGNSNNSYWLSDANQPLEGFPVVMGPLGGEGQQQFLRTRIGHLMVEERRQASDGLDPRPLFDLETLKGMMFSNRVHAAELVLEDVLAVCAMPSAEPVLAACNALANWDGRVNLESRGAQVFIEFWRAVRDDLAHPFQNVVDSETFWALDFDPEDPLNTPAGVDLTVQENQARVIAALSTAQSRLAAAGVALTESWGELQVLERNAQRIPIHGGPGPMGVYGAVSANLVEGGYINPSSGNSYLQAVTWDDSECPLADVILVPSQSTNPDSPHFADQTALYSDKQWLRFPFCEADIAAAQIGDTLVLED